MSLCLFIFIVLKQATIEDAQPLLDRRIIEIYPAYKLDVVDAGDAVESCASEGGAGARDLSPMLSPF